MKPKPPSHIVDALSLDRDATGKLLTWLTLETPAAVARVALTRDAVEQLWHMLDQTMAGWSCDCPAAPPSAKPKLPKPPHACTEASAPTIAASYAARTSSRSARSPILSNAAGGARSTTRRWKTSCTGIGLHGALHHFASHVERRPRATNALAFQ
jgi:hypothetical protein